MLAQFSLDILEEDMDAAIQEVEERVSSIKKLEKTDAELKLEVVSLESKSYLIGVSTEGYKVLNRQDEDAFPPAFESLHALLSHVSSRYRESFGASLASALSDLDALQQLQGED
jgi:hypothetical protein